MTYQPNKYDKIIEELQREIANVKVNLSDENYDPTKANNIEPIKTKTPTGKKKKIMLKGKKGLSPTKDKNVLTPKTDQEKVLQGELSYTQLKAQKCNSYNEKVNELLEKMKGHFEEEKKVSSQIVSYEKRNSDLKKEIFTLEFNNNANAAKDKSSILEKYEKELVNLYTNQGLLRDKRKSLNAELANLMRNDPEKSNPFSPGKILLKSYKYFVGEIENIISESRLYQINNDNEIRNMQINDLRDQITLRDDYIINAEKMLNKYDMMFAGNKKGNKKVTVKRHEPNFATIEEIDLTPASVIKSDIENNNHLKNGIAPIKSYITSNIKLKKPEGKRDYNAEILPLIEYNYKVDSKFVNKHEDFLNKFKVKKLGNSQSTKNYEVSSIGNRINKFKNFRESLPNVTNITNNSEEGKSANHSFITAAAKNIVQNRSSSLVSFYKRNEYKKGLKNFLKKDFVGRYYNSPYLKDLDNSSKNYIIYA